MAYIGTDGYLAVWLPGELPEDVLSESYIHLLGGGDSPETDGAAGETDHSRGFIIQDWFGPFLLGPTTRFLRGRC